jgi:D-threo-aldose 1-dehydrogenase
MEERELGRTGLRVPRLAFGTAPLASVFWGNEEATAEAAVAHAVGAGVRFFDTAPLYGLGESEARLGRGLSGVGRGEVLVATKFGRTLVGAGEDREAVFDFGYDAVRRSLAASLERLGRSSIDIAHVHDPDDHLGQSIEGTYRALAELRDQRVVKAVSLGTNVPGTLAFYLKEADLDCALLAGRWTLLDRTGGGVLDECLTRGVSVLAGGVFNSGLLADPRPGAWFDYAPAGEGLRRRAAALAEACERHGTDLRTAAIQFPLRHPAVTAVVLGMSSAAEVDANLASLAAPVGADLWTDPALVEGPAA